ncbi:MAG: murein L,D-transpeptidase catalytic domain family protein [Coxiellaceae bacterium]|nr:murein L,D-transpeptidase catalytic domain family protein [Coxiellaceae bacterium]
MTTRSTIYTTLASGLALTLLSTISYAKDFTNIRGLNEKALQLAQKAYHCEMRKGLIHNPHLTVVDYTRPSTRDRLWVLNMKTHKIEYRILASHGQASGDLYATHFSNRTNSHKSSRGLFLTKNTYRGKFGYSLRLDGLEKGINDNAFDRDIVVHGSKWVNHDFIKKYHRVGRTWGCLGLNAQISRQVINTISNGSLVFAYSKQENSDPNLKHC